MLPSIIAAGVLAWLALSVLVAVVVGRAFARSEAIAFAPAAQRMAAEPATAGHAA